MVDTGGLEPPTSELRTTSASAATVWCSWSGLSLDHIPKDLGRNHQVSTPSRKLSLSSLARDCHQPNCEGSPNLIPVHHTVSRMSFHYKSSLHHPLCYVSVNIDLYTNGSGVVTEGASVPHSNLSHWLAAGTRGRRCLERFALSFQRGKASRCGHVILFIIGV